MGWGGEQCLVKGGRRQEAREGENLGVPALHNRKQPDCTQLCATQPHKSIAQSSCAFQLPSSFALGLLPQPDCTPPTARHHIARRSSCVPGSATHLLLASCSSLARSASARSSALAFSRRSICREQDM